MFIDCSVDNANRIFRAIEQFGFDDLNLTARDFTTEDQVIQFGVAPNRIDVMTFLSGVSFDEVWDSREQAELDGVSVSFISREMLKRNKKACGRNQDLADLEYL